MTAPLVRVLASCQKNDQPYPPYVDLLACGHKKVWEGTRHRWRRCEDCLEVAMEGQDDLFGGTEGGTVEGLLDVIPNKGDTMNLGGYTVTNMGSFPVDPQDALPTPVARATDPGTSWAAAGSVRNQTQVHRFLISLLRQFGPMTDEEIAHRWKHQQVEWDLPLTSDSGLRTRRKELVDMGVAEATGEERRTKSNRKTKVWRLVDGG